MTKSHSLIGRFRGNPAKTAPTKLGTYGTAGLSAARGIYTMAQQEQLKSIKSWTMDGLSSETAGTSALQLKNDYGYNTDGVYWINLPTVGPTQIYCIMDSSYNGGGWMMAMKATTGTTFQYSSNYWTTINTLNPTDVTRNNADAKFDSMNYFPSTDIMAVWPDITTGTGGSITGLGVWTWLENNFYAEGKPITLVNFFNTVTGSMASGGSGVYKSNAKAFSGWASGIFSSQTDVQFYGFNYNAHGGYGVSGGVRWGFGWNENSEGAFPSVISSYAGSNDVSGGIGMDASYGNYSAGDKINCCQDTTGINRSARVEIYVR